MTACTVQNGAIFYGRAEGGDFHRLPSRGDLPGTCIYIHVHTELMVSLFIRCTMRCDIWAQPVELPR